MRILVAAHKRSGTLYIAKALQEIGLEVAHEIGTFNKDGMASSVHAIMPVGKKILVYAPPPLINRTVLVDKVLHQTRHPLKAIASSMTGTRRNFKWLMFETVGFPPGHFNDTQYWAMWTWLKWNEMIERYASYRYKIEDIKKEFPKICKEFNIKQQSLPEISKNTHTKEHPEVTWDELEKIDSNLIGQVKEMAQRYGYQTTDNSSSP